MVIALGIDIALLTFARLLFVQRSIDFNTIRLVLTRSLTMTLEFQLGGDILYTTMAPSWSVIGKPKAVVGIRTTVNYFLS